MHDYREEQLILKDQIHIAILRTNSLLIVCLAEM